jgi:toxin ParE1/3/4
MGRIVRTDQATSDPLDIWIHVKTIQSETKATALIRTIERKLRLLAGQPQMGRAREELRAGLHSFPVKPYVIFYQPLPDGILVVRVVHGRRDLDALFSEDSE